MRVFYLTGSIVITAVLLIVAFGNIGATCNSLFFFSSAVNSGIPVTFLVFGVAFLGIVAGVFYSALMGTFLKKNPEEDEAAF